MLHFMADSGDHCGPNSPAEGIRERKKRLTRELISNTATRMFLTHGFDAVKVTDIARECDVAEKTVYNYFPTKESLLLDREDEMAESIRQALGPTASKPPIDVALELLAFQLDGILASVPEGRRGVAALRRFTELLESTQSLRAAQRDLDTRLVGVAAHAMADRAGLRPDMPEVQMAAQAILGLWRIQFGALQRYAAEGMTVAGGLCEQVTGDVRRAARLIESGLWTFNSAVAAPGDRERMEAAAAAAQLSARQVLAALQGGGAEVDA
jgi:AcrR family transcriptional regulator